MDVRGRAGVVRRVRRVERLCDDGAGESMAIARQRSLLVRVWVEVLPGVVYTYCGSFECI